MQVVAMLNQKGGVGKSSTCHHLSGTLAVMGKRVLLLDNDPQSSLSQGFWGPVATKALDPAETIAGIYAGNQPFPDEVIKATGIPGIDLISGSRVLDDFNTSHPRSADFEVQSCLRTFLAEVARAGTHDVAIIDCQPTLYLASWAALVASDHVVVPLSPEDYAAMGVADVQESIALVQSGPNPGLRLAGYLLTKVGKKVIHKLYEEKLRDLYGADVFEAVVPEAVAFVEAISLRVPIAQHKPKGAQAKAMKTLADEFLARIDTRGIAAFLEVA
jgi:chromosome partitioning protein